MSQQLKISGLNVSVKPPRVAAEGLGFCWYPDVLKFSTGELMVAHSLNPDSGASILTGQAIWISKNGGETWEYAYDVPGFHPGGGEVRISLPDGSIVGPSYAGARPEPAGQWRNFATHYWRFDNGGQRYVMDAWGARILGLPRDVEPRSGWSRWSHAKISLFGTAVEVSPGRYVTTCCMTYQGDELETTEALVSEDAGRTWHYLSTIAGPAATPGANEGWDEPCMIQLADGALMCVSRVGGGRDQPLARAYSYDGGKTWSAPDHLPAWSVAPNMVRLQNGTIALSTGRPGIFLWLSADPRGQQWESIDVMDLHNTALGPGHHMSPGPAGLEPTPAKQYADDHFHFDDPWQTTSYTALLEVAPNRLFMVYDRMPYGWMPVPTDAEIRSRMLTYYPDRTFEPGTFIPRERSRIYLLELEIERA